MIRLAAQLALVVLLCEVALRLLVPHLSGLAPLLYQPGVRTDFDEIPDLPTLMRSSAQGYTPLQRRGDFIYNSRSMRTGEYGGVKKPGVFRIAVLGDSFANSSGGTPFRQMWPTRLEAELAQRLDREVEVFSLGVGGVGPGFELRLWELERELLRADLVVVGFFAGNDFTDAGGATPWQRSRLREHSRVWLLSSNLARLLAEPLPTSDWLDERAEPEPSQRGGTVADPGHVRNPRRSRLSQATLLRIEGNALQLCLLANRAWFGQRVEEVVDVLARFDSEVRLDGADFLVALIPGRVHVDEEFRGRVLRYLGQRPGLLLPGCPQRQLVERLAERGIESLDLFPAFQERVREQPLYWRGNTHWNVEGNALAAEELARFVAGRMAAVGAGRPDASSR